MGVSTRLRALGVDDSTLARALYSSDASLYRVPPTGVAVPADVPTLERLIRAAWDERVPVTMRGAGTSCAGNAVGPGLVVDCSRLDGFTIDAQARLAVVEPGVIAGELTAAGTGLRFGPDPSTSDRCTIGGMIGNNACGARTLRSGRTSDNVLALTALAGTGEVLDLDTRRDLTQTDSPLLTRLRQLVLANLGVIRTEFGRFPRQISGYALEHLLPENGFDVTRFLVGSEGTLAAVLSATVALAPTPQHRVLVVVGFDSLAAAGDAIPEVLAAQPSACEAMGARLVDSIRHRVHGEPVPSLPAGAAWLFVELSGDERADLVARADALVRALQRPAAVVSDAAEADQWWRLRADAAGTAGLALERPAHPGWEDAAVPPERLGDYLRDFEALLSQHGLDCLPYGHFGDGCVHARIDFPLDTADGPARLQAFLTDAARLVARHGGSMSGEHGDGRARSALLAEQYSPAALALFAEVKALFDPDNLLNPGVMVDPRPVTENLRLTQLPHPLDALGREVHRCTGVGRCVSSDSPIMCPSYRATGREQDSTRGRARILQEMVNGTLVTGGVASPEVAEALDLCLSCKACASECPTGVDMARYKAEVTDAALKGRLRPLTHYSLGWLPTVLGLTQRIPGVAAVGNAVLQFGPLARIASVMAGIDPRRSLPQLAAPGNHTRLASDPDPTVLLWADCNSAGIVGDGLAATHAVLSEAGQRVAVVGEGVCCGLTYTASGQLEPARRRLRKAIDTLSSPEFAGLPVVGIEPSCLAVWPSDAAWLLPDEPRVAAIANRVTTLAGFLDSLPDYEPPSLAGVRVLAQAHCHQRAILDFGAETRLLARAGAELTEISGCCGFAGSFGLEPAHYDLSVKIAEQFLLPAVRAADADTVLLADGLSCRTQVADLTGRQAVTFAEIVSGRAGL